MDSPSRHALVHFYESVLLIIYQNNMIIINHFSKQHDNYIITANIENLTTQNGLIILDHILIELFDFVHQLITLI